ncbi:hypothetical protein GJV44_00383 [Candidatus Vallotia cooleyia]|nr:hypothetical protein GJV44_00383 [Candidatus Vallotia cooleyia]
MLFCAKIGTDITNIQHTVSYLLVDRGQFSGLRAPSRIPDLGEAGRAQYQDLHCRARGVLLHIDPG